jgi:hypothetical protein
VNKTVTDKQGNVIPLCNYRWVDPDGREETCRAHAACEVCGQCSRLVGEHESGHCTGHFGLNQFIKVPGMEVNAARAELERVRVNQPKRAQQKRRPQRSAPVVERKPQLKKV